MATTKTLLEVKVHTDTETGDHHIGEIDFGISGLLDEHIRQYGNKGADDIVKTLGYLIHCVEKARADFQDKVSEDMLASGEASG